MKAIVIGAGVVGSAIAYRLAAQGASVVLLEAGRVGGGTSFTSGARVNSSDKTPREYHEFNVRGMKAHLDLREEFGGAPWLHVHGRVQWLAPGEPQAKQKTTVERLQSWGYPVEEISLDDLREMEPDINPDTVDGAPIMHYPDEASLDTAVFCSAMVRGAIRRGAVLREHCRVDDLEVRGGRVQAVQTADGERIEGDVVINCAGRWADTVAKDPSLNIPLAPTVGFIVYTPPVAVSVGRLIHSPAVRLRPDGAGRLMLRIEAMDKRVAADEATSPTMPQAVEIMNRAIELIPRLAGVSAEAARIAIRPRPSDGQSAIGFLPQLDNCYLVVTHSGVTLSALMAHVVADEVLHKRPHHELDRFRPARFFNGSAPARVKEDEGLYVE